MPAFIRGLFGPRAALQSRLASTQASSSLPSAPSTSPGSSNPFHAQTLPLPDGRALGFAEYGSPTGYPVLYFHGYPSSRLEADPVDALARRLDIRLLALDRPGFGLSTRQPGRTLLDWPADVARFATALRLPRFAVLGLSGGGPHALACAQALPAALGESRLTAVGLFASGPHWGCGAGCMSRPRRVLKWMADHVPFVLHVLLGGVVAFARGFTRLGAVTRRIDAWLEREGENKKAQKAQGAEDATRAVGAAEADGSGAQMTPPAPHRSIAEQRDFLLRMLLHEPFRQGVGPTVEETRLLAALDWGFELEEVDFDPVLLWHGERDANAPIEMLRQMASRVSGARLRESPGETHYTMFPHLEGALAELVDAARKKAK